MRNGIILALVAIVAGCAEQAGPGQATQTPTEASPAASPERQELTVTAVEYEFQGVPATLPAGEASIRMENTGEEPHEMSIVRITTDATLEELLELPEREAQQQIEETGHLFAKPGEDQRRTFDLQPGRYGYVCFVSTKQSDKMPHAALGMAGELSVA
jgi:plastocyanin